MGSVVGEVALWRQVINQTMLDALGVVSACNGRNGKQRAYHREKHQREARAWFLDPDFDRVCEMANVNARHIRRKAHELMASGEVDPRIIYHGGVRRIER